MKEFRFTDVMTHASQSITGEGTLAIPVEELDEIEKAAADLLQQITRPQRAASRFTRRSPANPFSSDEENSRTTVSPTKSKV